MLPSVKCGRRCRGSGLRAQHSLGGLKALEEREQRGSWRQRPGLAILPPDAVEHASPEFRAGLDVHVRRVERLVVEPHRDSRVIADQPKICCAHETAIEFVAFRTGRVRHASSRMPFVLQNPYAT